MPYVRRTWQNAPSSATPLNAAALNNIEDGVEAATEAIADLPATIGAVVDTAVPVAVAATAVPIGQSSARLARWDRQMRSDPTALYYMDEGDSTANWATGPSPARVARLAGISVQSTAIPALYHTAPGQGLAGMTADLSHFIDCGNSGMKLQQFLSDYDANVTTPKSLRWALSQMNGKVGVVVHRWGINDLRQQERTREQLSADLVRLIGIWRAAQPQVDHVLTVPNSLLTTNQGGFNYVRESPTGTINPAGLAQTISERLRWAYLQLVDLWPNTVVLDTQAAVYGTVSLAYNGSALMSDQLHPRVTGVNAEIDYLVGSLLGVYDRKKLQPRTLALAATALSPYTPWTINPSVLDDPEQFVKVAAGETSSDTVAGSRQSFSWPTAGDIAPYDIVRMPDGTVYQLPSSATSTQNGPTTRLSSASAVANQAGALEVFRQVKTGDATMDRSVFDKSKRFRKFFRVVSATATTATLRPVSVTDSIETTTPAELAALIAAGNVVYFAGDAANPTTLTGGQWSSSGSNIVLTGLATDYSAYTGRLVAIIGTQSSSAPGPAGASGPAGGVASAIVSGRVSIPAVFGPISAGAGTNGTEYAVPITFLANGSITKLSIGVSTAVAGSAVRLGVRSATGQLPDGVLADGGSALDCSTTGLKTVTLGSPLAVTAGTLYFLVAHFSGSAAANLRIINGISPLITMRDNVANDNCGSYTRTPGTTDGALAASWGGSYTPASYVPLITVNIQ